MTNNWLKREIHLADVGLLGLAAAVPVFIFLAVVAANWVTYRILGCRP